MSPMTKRDFHLADLASNGDMDTLLNSVISRDGLSKDALSVSQHNPNMADILFMGTSTSPSLLDEKTRNSRLQQTTQGF